MKITMFITLLLINTMAAGCARTHIDMGSQQGTMNTPEEAQAHSVAQIQSNDDPVEATVGIDAAQAYKLANNAGHDAFLILVNSDRKAIIEVIQEHASPANKDGLDRWCSVRLLGLAIRVAQEPRSDLIYANLPLLRDEDGPVREKAAANLVRLSESDFNDGMRQEILRMLTEAPNAALCTACGVAGVTESMPVLRDASGSSDEELAFAATMALSRLGDKKSTAVVIDRVRKEGKRMPGEIEWLVYTRQPEAVVSIAEDWLLSDERAISLGNDHRPLLLAEYGVEALHRMAPNTPPITLTIAKEDIERYRQWWHENKKQFLDERTR